MNMKFTRFVCVGLTIASTSLMAQEYYSIGSFPTEIAGWEIIIEEDGSRLLYPVYPDVNTPSYGYIPGNWGMPGNMLDGFPEQIPGWVVWAEPDGSKLLFPQHGMGGGMSSMVPPTHQVQGSIQSKPAKPSEIKTADSTKSGTDDNKPSSSSMAPPDAVYAKDIPVEIPGWKIETEADGSKILYPQNEVVDATSEDKSTDTESATDNQVKPDMETKAETEAATMVPQSTAGMTPADAIYFENFPESIPGWEIVREPDGSILLFPQNMNQEEKLEEGQEEASNQEKKSAETAESVMPGKFDFDDFPHSIPGWTVITEPDGSKLLFPQFPGPEGMVEDEGDTMEGGMSGGDEAKSRDDDAANAYTESDKTAFNNLPAIIPGWDTVAEPDGSKLLYPKYINEEYPEKKTAPEKQTAQAMKDCFATENYPYAEEGDVWFMTSPQMDQCETRSYSKSKIWEVRNY